MSLPAQGIPRFHNSQTKMEQELPQRGSSPVPAAHAGGCWQTQPLLLYLFVFLLSLSDPGGWALIAALVWCWWLKGGINNSLERTAWSSKVPICLLWLRAAAPWALTALCFPGQREAGDDCWGCSGFAGKLNFPWICSPGSVFDLSTQELLPGSQLWVCRGSFLSY